MNTIIDFVLNFLMYVVCPVLGLIGLGLLFTGIYAVAQDMLHEKPHLPS